MDHVANEHAIVSAGPAAALAPSGAMRLDVLGCPFDVLSFEQAAELIRNAAVANRRLRLVTANVDFVMKARADATFARELTEADVVVADGVPILWAARLLGYPLRERIAGVELVERCARISADEALGVALVGARPGVADRAAALLMTRYPGARISAVPTPMPLDDAGSREVAEHVRQTASRILLVALGAPRQERWVRTHLAGTGCAVGIGVGGSFDILSGDRPRAPRVLRDHGFEWFHRFLQEPTRLGRRYFLDDSPFIAHIAAATVRRHLGRGL